MSADGEPEGSAGGEPEGSAGGEPEASAGGEPEAASPPPPPTQNDHYQYGWGGAWSDAPGEDGGRYSVSFGRCARRPGTWREECIRAALLIGERRREPLVLACSSGWDSEVMLRSFLAAGVPFEVAILEFERGLNRHDVSHAHRLCDELGLRRRVHRLDLLDFIERELDDYADRYALTMPAMAPQIWLAERIEGAPVFGGGDLYLKRAPYSPEVVVEKHPHSTAIARCLRRAGREGYPSFYFYTPELMQSYLLHPLMRVFIHTSFCMRITSFKRFRAPIYHSSWPELSVQRHNANGWELIRPLYDGLRRRLVERHGARCAPRLFGYREMIERLAWEGAPVDLPAEPEIDATHRDPDLWPHKEGAP